jgi:hypothetical protein
MFRHPSYYKKLRERNKSDQVISRRDSTEAGRRSPGPGLEVQIIYQDLSGPKQQASSSKRQASSSKRLEPQAASVKPRG